MQRNKINNPFLAVEFARKEMLFKRLQTVRGGGTKTTEANMQEQEQINQVAKRALAIPDQATSLAIINNETYERGTFLLKGIKTLRQEIDDTFRPIREKAHATWKETIEQQKRIEEPLIIAEGIIKPRLAKYLDEQERARRTEELRLAEIARKEAEERQLAEAALAEKAGDKEAAEEILNRETEVPPVILPKATPKVEGISIRQVWKYAIIDEGLIPREYLCVDHTKIGGVVRALKEQAKIPGLKIYKESIMSASGK